MIRSRSLPGGDVPRDARVDAYLFDLDGTLADTEVLWVEATTTFLRTLGKTVSDADVMHWVYGRSWHDIYAGLIRLWPELALGPETLGARLQPHLDALRDQRDIGIPGSVELLRSLAGHTPVAIVSGSPRQEIDETARRLGIADRLAFWLGSEDYSPGKPDPACYRLAAQRLAVPEARCVVFEDSAAGVRAARRAGMPVVALARPGAPEQNLSEADWVVRDLGEYRPDALFARRAAGGAGENPP